MEAELGIFFFMGGQVKYDKKKKLALVLTFIIIQNKYLSSDI